MKQQIEPAAAKLYTAIHVTFLQLPSFLVCGYLHMCVVVKLLFLRFNFPPTAHADISRVVRIVRALSVCIGVLISLVLVV